MISLDKYAGEIAFWRDLYREGRVEKWPDGRYCAHLMLPADYFKGMRILDVGCGPLGHNLDFTDCEIVGLEPLVDEYRRVGYPCDHIEYVKAHAEDMPFDDGEFDAVISVNAIDHVDDFEQSIKEIERVCKGIIRVECHYHPAQVCEPLELTYERVRSAFSPNVECLMERNFHDTFFPNEPMTPCYLGSVALWSNDPCLA